jgi:hypothetical protein
VSEARGRGGNEIVKLASGTREGLAQKTAENWKYKGALQNMSVERTLAKKFGLEHLLSNPDELAEAITKAIMEFREHEEKNLPHKLSNLSAGEKVFIRAEALVFEQKKADRTKDSA